MTAPSQQYELLVADLHQALIKADGVNTTNVKHNTTIKGKSGASHTIDVYWEFKLGGTLYKTCIECKHYNTKVKKSHVAAFAAIIDDIGGTTGIFATTCGFQRGALLLARHRNIRLVVVNPLLKEVNIHYSFLIPRITPALEFDLDYVRKRMKELGLSKYKYQSIRGGDEMLWDKDGNPQVTLNELIRKNGTDEGAHTIALQNHYLVTDLGRLPLKAITYSVKHSRIEMQDRIEVEGIARAIMEDVLENSTCYLNDDGSISRVET